MAIQALEKRPILGRTGEREGPGRYLDNVEMQFSHKTVEIYTFPDVEEGYELDWCFNKERIGNFGELQVFYSCRRFRVAASNN